MHIDEDYKIDFPPDTYLHKLKYGLNLAGVEHLFITHSHRDHFYFQDLKSRNVPYARVEDGPVLNVYGNEAVGKLFAGIQPGNKHGCRFVRIKPFSRIEAGGMTVYPVLADHAGDEDAVFFLFENAKTEKRALVVNDTGFPPEESMAFIADFKLDFVSMDCTNGNIDSDTNHMGVKAVARLKKVFEERGILNPAARCFATHFSHNGGLLHEKLEDVLRPEGIESAFDGLAVELQR